MTKPANAAKYVSQYYVQISYSHVTTGLNLQSGETGFCRHKINPVTCITG